MEDFSRILILSFLAYFVYFLRYFTEKEEAMTNPKKIKQWFEQINFNIFYDIVSSNLFLALSLAFFVTGCFLSHAPQIIGINIFSFASSVTYFSHYLFKQGNIRKILVILYVLLSLLTFSAALLSCLALIKRTANTNNFQIEYIFLVLEEIIACVSIFPVARDAKQFADKTIANLKEDAKDDTATALIELITAIVSLGGAAVELAATFFS